MRWVRWRRFIALSTRIGNQLVSEKSYMITNLPTKRIEPPWQWQTFLKVLTYKIAAKINWHSYGTKLCHCHQTWNWVIGSLGHLGHLSRPGHRVIILTGCETRVFRFSKKAQDRPKDIKIYIFVKIRPTVIEILTFNKRSSKFYFLEACKRQSAIKTGKPLDHCKRLSAT